MASKRLYIDTETFSELELKKVGSYAYAEHSSTEIMICTYAFDDDRVKTWDCTDGSVMPRDLLRGLRRACSGRLKIIGANFLLFDRLIIKHCWGIDIPVNGIEDTMIQAFRHALPGSLDMQCQVLQIDEAQAKDKAGKALINRFCKPTPKNYKVRRYTSETHPEDWKRFLNYARKDVEAMREVYWAMPTWGNSEFEDRVLELDIKINDRGFYVDTALANAAIAAVTAHKKELQQTAQDNHGSSLTGASFLPTLRELAPAHQVPNAQKSTLNGLLDDEDLPDEARELIEMRLGASSTASTKYHPLLRGLSKDGRRRGCLQYGGAKRTLRWSGKSFQPQNLARGYYHDKDLERGIKALLRSRAHRRFDVAKLAASTVRSCVAPESGNKFTVADYSNVEGRGLAWLAGEEKTLDVFRAGTDLYKVLASSMFKVNYDDVNKDQRQVAKACILGLGYGGGVAAFLTFAKNLGLDLLKLSEDMDGTFPDHIWKAALKGFEFARIQEKNKRAPKGQKAERPSYDLPKKVWLTCDSIKRMYRESNPHIQQFWWDLEEAAVNAIRNPGRDYWAGARVRTDGNRAIRITRPLDGKNPSWWLKVELPSGRILSYPGIGLSVEIEIDEDSGKENKRTKIRYQGENQTTRQWSTQYTYGGKLAENCISGDMLILQEHMGLMPLHRANPNFKVWDGLEFVTFDKLVYKGKQTVISKYGAILTPDHKILTKEGWTDASSCERHNRITCWLPSGVTLGGLRWEKINMGDKMRLRKSRNNASNRIDKAAKARGNGIMRLYEEGNNREKTTNARHVKSSRILRMEVNGRPLPFTNASSLEKLRRTRDNGLCQMAGKFRELLGGYGSYLSNRKGFKQKRQQRQLLRRELSLALAKKKREQQANNPFNEYASGINFSGRSGATLQNKLFNASLPVRQWVDARARADVYDLVNCGPRNQFVVFGNDGPVIAHNCTQALCRDLLANALLNVEENGYPIVLHVHDEIITEVPDTDEYSVKGLEELMCTLPDWAQGFPLAAEGACMKRYAK